MVAGSEDLLLEDGDPEVFGHIAVELEKSGVEGEEIAMDLGILEV